MTQLKLELLHRESERGARLAGSLAAVVSLGHEINNPLQGITGALDVLRARSSTLSPEVLAELEVVAEQALRIRDVVRRMTRLAEPAFQEYAPGVPMVDLAGSQVEEGED
jgi:nitrogen-specific signal transduction histidine kinase